MRNCGLSIAILKVVLFVSTLYLVSGCATILTEGSKQGVLVKSDPPGADILVEGELVGRTPAYVLLPRQQSTQSLVLESTPGHKTYVVPIESKYRWGMSFWRNFIFLYGAPIGWGVDLLTGRAWKLENPEVVELQGPQMSPGRLSRWTLAPERPLRVAIAPPQAPTLELSDELGRMIEKNLREDKPEIQVLNYDDTLKYFINRDYDFNNLPNAEELATLYAELRVDFIYHSEIIEGDGRQRLHGIAVSVTGAERSWSQDYGMGPLGHKLDAPVPWYHKTTGASQSIPNTPFVEFGARGMGLTVNGGQVAAHGAGDLSWQEELGEILVAVGLTRLTPPRSERRSYLRFQFAPSLRLNYNRIYFPDLPIVRHTEFRYFQIGGGIGPEGGVQMGSHYIYMNFVPFVTYNLLSWSTGGKGRESRTGSFSLRLEIGYTYFMTKRWSLRLFTRSTTVDARSFARAFDELAPDRYKVETGNDFSTGISIGYTFDQSLDI